VVISFKRIEISAASARVVLRQICYQRLEQAEVPDECLCETINDLIDDLEDMGCQRR